MSFGAQVERQGNADISVVFFSERRKQQQQQPNKNQEKNKRGNALLAMFGMNPAALQEEENNAYNTRRHSTHNNWMANTFSMWNESSVKQKI